MPITKCPVGVVLLMTIMMVMVMNDVSQHGNGDKDNKMTNNKNVRWQDHNVEDYLL